MLRRHRCCSSSSQSPYLSLTRLRRCRFRALPPSAGCGTAAASRFRFISSSRQVRGRLAGTTAPSSRFVSRPSPPNPRDQDTAGRFAAPPPLRYRLIDGIVEQDHVAAAAAAAAAAAVAAVVAAGRRPVTSAPAVAVASHDVVHQGIHLLQQTPRIVVHCQRRSRRRHRRQRQRGWGCRGRRECRRCHPTTATARATVRRSVGVVVMVVGRGLSTLWPGSLLGATRQRRS